MQACDPDFDLWRREGKLACNENTVLTLRAIVLDRWRTRCSSVFNLHNLTRRSTPLLALVYRPQTDKMHLGARTWNDACAPEMHMPEIVRSMCLTLADYTLQLPIPAVIGSTSLVRYEFIWVCVPPPLFLM